jgi:hypothetical protein
MENKTQETTGEPVNFIQRYNYGEFRDFIRGKENRDNWGLEFRKGQPYRTMYGKGCDGSLWNLPDVQYDKLEAPVEVRMVDRWHFPKEKLHGEFNMGIYKTKGKNILKKVFEMEEDDQNKLSEILRPHVITYPIFDFIYQDFYKWAEGFAKRSPNSTPMPSNFIALMESHDGKVGLFQSFDYRGDPHTRFDTNWDKMEPYNLPTLVITRRMKK